MCHKLSLAVSHPAVLGQVSQIWKFSIIKIWVGSRLCSINKAHRSQKNFQIGSKIKYYTCKKNLGLLPPWVMCISTHRLLDREDVHLI